MPLRHQQGSFTVRDGQQTQSYQHVVLVDETEFPRLELGRYERHDVLTPCIQWCHETVGLWPAQWMELSDTACRWSKFYFTREMDALMFLLRWS